MIGLEINNKTYHESPAKGSSTFKAYISNALKAYKQDKGLIKQKETKALKMGSLVHCFVLEPQEFNNDFLVVDSFIEPKEELLNSKLILAPNDCLTPSGSISNSKKAKEILSELPSDAIVVTPTDMEMINLSKDKRMKVTAKEVEEAKITAQKALDYEFKLTIAGQDPLYIDTKNLLQHDKVVCERAFFAVIRAGDFIAKDKNYTFKDGDIEVKCKPDILLEIAENVFIVIDLKTGEDASINTAEKVGSKFLNPVQQAHYTKVLEANGLTIYKFLFLYAGKEEWSEAQHYEYDTTSREWGEKMLSKAIALYLLAENGEVREAPFINGKYDREPIISIPTYMHFME